MSELKTTKMVAIQINAGTKIHVGDKFGSYCGAGFNRKGGRPIITLVPGTTVTCAKCARYEKNM